MARRFTPKSTEYTDMYHYLSCLHDLGMDPQARELYLTGEPGLSDEFGQEPGVEYTMATRFIKNLRFLALESSDPVLIHMKTCGGSYEEGFAIYDAIKSCPCYVTILSYTHARSMSSIILQAADKRVLMPNSYFLIHWGTTNLCGDHQQVLSNAEFARKMEGQFLDVYLDAMQGSDTWSGNIRSFIEKQLRDKMGRKTDVILTSEETISWGLADEIFDGDWKDLK